MADDVDFHKQCLKKATNCRNKLLELLKSNLRLTTLDASEKHGILNAAQRISELIKIGAPVGKDWTTQKDSTGALHRVRVYIWLGEHGVQGDLFRGGI